MFAAQPGLGTIRVKGDLYDLTAPTTGDRPDVDRVYPNTGSHHGFQWQAAVRDLAGDQKPTTICIYQYLQNAGPGYFLFQETNICSAVTLIPAA